MKFKSEHLTQASGSIGGVTYGRAKGGVLYRRSRAIPVNPNSENQVQVRTAVTQLVTHWVEQLTNTERVAWNTYAQNVTVVNVLGDAVHNSGQNWFIAVNTPRLQSDAKLGTTLGIIEAAPGMFDRGDFSTPTLPTYDAATGSSMAYTDTDEWANETGGAMFVYQGRPRNQSRLFFNGPFRLVGTIIGDDTTPPASPFTLTPANFNMRGFPLVAGQLIQTVVSVARADGRLSTRRTLGDTIVTV